MKTIIYNIFINTFLFINKIRILLLLLILLQLVEINFISAGEKHNSESPDSGLSQSNRGLQLQFISPAKNNGTINSTIRNFTIQGTCTNNVINMEYKIDNGKFTDITNKSFLYSRHWSQEISLPRQNKNYKITIKAIDDKGTADSKWIIVKLQKPRIYYIDFINGNDSNKGTTINAPWKHCPGDDNAKSNVARHNPTGGDIFIFKGGTTYRGKIIIKGSGKSNLIPVVYDGDSGTFNTKWSKGKAIVEGSKVIADKWKQCKSKSQVKGNPNYINIWYINAPNDYDFFQRPIYEDDEFLWFAQYPDPSNRLYNDNPSEFKNVSSAKLTKTSCKDHEVFKQDSSDYWNDAYIYIYHIPNDVSLLPVTGYLPKENTIKFKTRSNIEGIQIVDGKGLYALVNHPFIITKPGEYCYIKNENKIYIWPLRSDNPNSHTYTYAIHDQGFEIRNKKYIVINNFKIQKYYAPTNASYEGSAIRLITGNRQIYSENIVISNNEITKLRSMCRAGAIITFDAKNVIVENNYIHDCQKNNSIYTDIENIVIRNNTIERMTSTPLSIRNGPNIQVIDNTIKEIYGTHASIITLYDCDTVLVARNVFLKRPAETNSILRSKDVTIFGNVYNGNIANWGNNSGKMKLLNNTIVEVNGPGGVMWDTDDQAYYISINNIIQKGGFADERKYNIYTAVFYDQKPRYRWFPKDGEIIDYIGDESAIFVNFKNHDFHLKKNSPAFNTGTDIAPYLPVDSFPYFDFSKDIDGNQFYNNGKYTIGAYGYKN